MAIIVQEVIKQQQTHTGVARLQIGTALVYLMLQYLVRRGSCTNTGHWSDDVERRPRL